MSPHNMPMVKSAQITGDSMTYQHNKEFFRVSSEPLVTWMKENNMNSLEAGQRLGYSDGGIRGFMRDGLMPRVLGNLLKEMEAAKSLRKEPAQVHCRLVILSGNQVQGFDAFCAAFNITTQEVPLP